jgi:hypothetical protein
VTVSHIPRVSICVPNLNTRLFLPERFQSIFDQSFRDWELLVYDSYSDDGSWEYIAALAVREPRMRAWQGPRQGTPGSWTPCLRAARGEFVYIATSDDTIPPDCIEKLVAALDANPDCDLAHCPLRPIDEQGREIDALSRWWRRESMFALSSGPLLNVPHTRKAPLDGALHLLGASVYISITQLLIRRSLFDRIGFFERRWGSVGDFNWSMRAGLSARTAHVPDTWGGWRIHAGQATAAVAFASAEQARTVDDMIEDALSSCAQFQPAVQRVILGALAADAKALRELTRQVAARREARALVRRGYLALRLLSGSRAARHYVSSRLTGRTAADWLYGRLVAADNAPFLSPAVSRAAAV